MSTPIIDSVIYTLIVGGLAGYFIGYLVKKLSNFALILGIFFFLLMCMVYANAINLNLNEMGATVTRFASAFASLGLTALASSAPFVGSFILGLVIGLTKVS
jgi:uncharacterized membrane protein (Fun14 family)